MYKVYWTEALAPSEMFPAINEQPRSKDFDSKDMVGALNLMESLRRRRKAGENLSFIGMVAEDPNSVGEPGVSDKLPEGYDWKKRRI